MDWLNKIIKLIQIQNKIFVIITYHLQILAFVKNIKNNLEDFCLKCNIEKKNTFV